MTSDAARSDLARWACALGAIGLAAALGGCDACEGEFCDDFLSIEFEKAEPWHGTYEVVLQLGGDTVHCSFHVPSSDAAVDPCDDEHTHVGAGGVIHHGTPERVEITVSSGGHILAEATIEPHYETPDDWSRACGPRCEQSTDQSVFVESTEPSPCSSYCENGWCNPWTQDCAPGEKCVAWDRDGDGSWNALRCVVPEAEPRAPGTWCTVGGSAVSGIDDCEIGAMCFGVDPVSLVGECVALCTGSPDAPVCPDACDRCVIANAGVLALCLPACDPLAPACEDARGCYPNADGFVCLPHGPSRSAIGEPCTDINGCTSGFCAPAERVPGCESPSGCCAAYCDTTAQDPCGNASPEVACVPWWSDDAPPTDACVAATSVGACVLPA